ncbi:dynamin family protein [Metarhizium robertsii]|uniref:Dynamin, GTPase domain protein n=2 Tax=Metarhizium robertsii TaxID=568076 RepID=E9EKT5_METRA|nr:Dynamin, GTPase domain protein [Metarhizium robertsii ARSEF 23]EFZ03870.1 Dynamin, GTPase domain protein [Metarhizium robertsii ARSEF 23]EXU94937.1 dynamin family protein [Metarhizium robertsii]
MVLKQLSPERIEGLCTKEHLHLLNAIDSLRSQGISHYVSLPQIIVCGDQSSGKSSVLEAISGVSFPVKSNLCTRFPTELILRKARYMSVKVSIVPHHSRSDPDKASLSGFDEKLDSLQDLPDLIENAKAAMGIMTLGKAFSKDLLRIEISGPDRPHLTIVDLPGLIHSENKQQSASDIELISDVVKGYMTEPRSIILAVVSAKNDYANQIVLKLAREADRSGTRTLGVITKPDTLSPSSSSEAMYVSLARNQDVEFRLGWHVLRNRDTDIEAWTLAQRDTNESEFFQGLLGRAFLPTNWIASELPNLMEEIATKSAQCQDQLDKLGQPRTNAREQRLYLVQISQTFQATVQAATDGTYGDLFFGDAASAPGYRKRIRAVVQNLNRDFATELRARGRRFRIVSDPETDCDPNDHAILLTKDDFVAKVVGMIDQSRGRELPGTFSPMIVSDLFKEQSSPWKQIAAAHVKNVWNAARLFLNQLIVHIADETTVNAISETIIEPALDSILKTLHNKVSQLLEPHRFGHPITYNASFTDTLLNIRRERRALHFSDILRSAFGDFSATSGRRSVTVDIGDLLQRLIQPEEQDMSRLAASEALDCLDAYYEVALKRFTDDVAVEVIEVSLMAEEVIARIAGETKESRAARDELNSKLKVLQSGFDMCNKYSGYRVTDLLNGKYGSDDARSARLKGIVKETVEIPQGRAYDTLERSTADFLPSATDQYSEEDITSPTEAYDYPPECVAAEECPVEEPAATVDDDSWATTVGKKNKKKAKKCQGFTGMKASETKCEERDW